MYPSIDAHIVLILGPTAALAAALLALAALGFEPALHALSVPEWPPSTFRFTARTIHPAVMLATLLLVGGFGVLISAMSRQAWLLIATPALIGASHRLTLISARAIYQRKLAPQVLLAVSQLAGKTSGSGGALLGAFREIGRESPWPLREEWAWVERHLNVPYESSSGGRTQTYFSDHAYALRCLAAQTPLEVHAHVLDTIALIYEQGVESHAGGRLRQLDELLREQDRLRRALTTQFGRVRNQAFIITGAMGAILIWLLASQRDRIYTAFMISPFGPLAAVWFSFWLVLPVVAGLMLARPSAELL